MKLLNFWTILIVALELAVFVCGLKVVSNRHESRSLFIELDREQQTARALFDEKNQLLQKLAIFEQPKEVEKSALRHGFKVLNGAQTVVLKKGSERSLP